MTASQLRTNPDQAPTSRTSPSMRSKSRSEILLVSLVRRKRQRTCAPRSTRRRTTTEPMKPLPPVTNTRIPLLLCQAHLLSFEIKANNIVEKRDSAIDGKDLSADAVHQS